MWFASEEEEDRFAHALLFSLLIHALVLGYVKGVEPLRRNGGGGALTVTLPGPPAERPPVATRQQLVQAATLEAPTATSATPLPQPRPRVAAVPPAPTPVPPRANGTSGGGGTRATARRGYGVVDVVMIVGGDGHPQTLIWDSLPALTQPQFDELERLVRRQAYPSSAGARITQEIDVFGLLGIGRRTDANPASDSGSPQ